MSRVDRVLNRAERWTCTTGVAAAFLLVIAIAVQIVARAAGRPIAGIFEGAEILMVAIVFLPLAQIQAVNEHIRMDVVTGRLSQKWRIIFDTFALLLSLAAFSIIAWQSLLDTIRSFEMGITTMGLVQIPVWPGQMLVPISSALLCLRFIVQISANVLGVETTTQRQTRERALVGEVDV